MAEIVNLKRARKAKARAEKEKSAAGQPRGAWHAQDAEEAVRSAAKDKAEQGLSGHRLEKAPDDN